MLNITAARRSKRTVSELNIAPLIDMVFILLIFSGQHQFRKRDGYRGHPSHGLHGDGAEQSHHPDRY